jgi:hypothetical protein
MTPSAPRAIVPERAERHARTLSVRDQDLLWQMEERFWTSGADSARATTASDAVMIFPYPPGILQGDQIWQHLRKNTGWRSVVLAERRVTRRDDIAILTYKVSAEKPDIPIFAAHCASTYLHDEDRWLRLSHTQTACN